LKFNPIASYKGALSNYRYANWQFSNLLDFLSQVKNPDKIWIGDNLDWTISHTQVPNNYDTYIFGYFGEFVNTDFLQKINIRLADKKLILLSSTDCSTFDLSNFQKFYLEHLHHWVKHYPKTVYSPLRMRSYQHSILVGRLAVHKIIALAQLKVLYPNLLYSYQKKSSGEIYESNFFSHYQTIHNINLSSDLKQQIQQLFDDAPVTHFSKNDNQSSQIWFNSDLPAYSNSIFHWSVESIYQTLNNFPKSYLTEKSMKPFTTGTPFAVLGQKHTQERLCRLGFQPYFDYQKLDDTDDNFRLLDTINAIDIKDLDHLQSIVDFNYNWFYNNFFDHVEKINADTKRTVLDYINL
jgi:hypothetical protein